eukprot:scaffold5480_cov111-Isochrysis_galbana.AAC.5
MACVGEGCHEQATLSTGASKVKTPLPSPTLSCAPTRLPTQRPFYPLPLSHAILLYSSTSFHSSPSSSLRRWSKSASLASCSSAPTSTLATTSCVTTSCASVPSSGATIITPAERSSTPSTVTWAAGGKPEYAERAHGKEVGGRLPVGCTKCVSAGCFAGPHLCAEVVFHADAVLANGDALLPPLVTLDERLARGDLAVDALHQPGDDGRVA